jgi:hypothetical protein
LAGDKDPVMAITAFRPPPRLSSGAMNLPRKTFGASKEIGAEMNTKMNLHKIAAATLLTVAFSGCGTTGGPGATALDIGGSVVGAAGGLAGAVFPYGNLPFDLLAGGMQMAADHKREAERQAQSEQAEQNARAGPANSEAPVQLAEQASNSSVIQAGNVAPPCDTTAPVALDGSGQQSAPCRQADAD